MKLLQRIIRKVLDEGRLAYKILGQNYQSCNGGSFDWTPYLPTDKSPGPWLPEIRELALCSRGYHVTADPAIWPGNVVYLCETRKPVRMIDKTVHATLRLLKRVWPEDCLDPRVYVRVMFPFLSGANLSGANLSGANLYGADLSVANLSRANLYGADLSWADLSVANLSRANLYRADLSWADLYGANLTGADLTVANLSRANLTGADLTWARRYQEDSEIPGWRLNAGGMLGKA